VTYKIYNTVAQLPKRWNGLTNDIFLKTPFLSALENSSPSNIKTYFIGVFSGSKHSAESEILVGIAIVQQVGLFSDDIFRRQSDSTLKEIGKRCVSLFLKGNALVIGNLMHTGSHAYWFDKGKISQTRFLEIILDATEELSKQIKAKFSQKISIVAIKDFFENDKIHLDAALFRSHHFFKARVQPNMVFDPQPNWNTTEDYVAEFNKKYRRRHRTAIKKRAAINSRELNLEAIKSLNLRIYELYENVSDNAGVNSFKLHQQHFYEMKLQLKDDFKIFGYFINNELVGFYTLIINGNSLETYFLGYKASLQHKHQMYLNMLFDMVGFGIKQGTKQIVFARTAMEIKSSVGAKPKEMSIYLKHNTFLLNRIFRQIVKFMNPVREWQERHPFS